MDKFNNQLSKIAMALMAIVPGIYLVNYVGISLFHLPSGFYYILLVSTGIAYGACIVGVYYIIVHKFQNKFQKRREHLQ